jgi:hypothetical protein
MSKAKKPKKSAQEKLLLAAQTRELSRTQEEIDERKRRILRGQYGSRGTMLSGGERGVRPGEARGQRGAGASTPRSTLGPQIRQRSGKMWKIAKGLGGR